MALVPVPSWKTSLGVTPEVIQNNGVVTSAWGIFLRTRSKLPSVSVRHPGDVVLRYFRMVSWGDLRATPRVGRDNKQELIVLSFVRPQCQVHRRRTILCGLIGWCHFPGVQGNSWCVGSLNGKYDIPMEVPLLGELSF